MRARELVNRGESPDRARELALERFGDYESERRECVAINERRRRKMMWADYITELRQDLRYGLRTLRRAPGFTAAALVTLAIGIGANAAVFSVVNSVLLKPLPYPHADQLVGVWHLAPGAPGRSGGLNLSPSMYFTYADENRTFQGIGIWTSGPTTVTGLAEPEEVRSILVTHGVLQALDVQPVLGRWLDQSDQIPQGPATLMLACANVANLLLVRGEVRQRELAIRAALGTGVGRIVRELLLEGVWLGLVGAVLGLALAYVGIRFLLAAAPASLPRLSEIAIDPRALAFTFALSLLSTLIFGLIPAMKSARPQISNALHSGGRASSGRGERARGRNLLVVAQVALAVVLLVSAVLMIRSFQALLAVPPGFAEPQSLQTTRISIPVYAAQQPAQVARMQQAILDKLAAIPGVTSVAFSSSMPMEGVDPPWDGLEAEASTGSASETRSLHRFKFVSPGLFQTMGTRLAAGRDFTWTDLSEGRSVVMVSENFARELWTTPLAAVGKRLRWGGSETPWRDVIGVSADIHDNGVHEPAPTTVYWPVMVSRFSATAPLFIARSVTFAIRSPQAGTPAFLREVQAAVWSVNKNLALTSVRTMQDAYDRSLARTSFTLVMLTIAAAIALVLAVVGVYGITSYVISLQAREIGIRLTLGLEPAGVVRMFVSHGLALVGIGVLIGLGIAVGVTRSMAFLLFGIRQVDPVTYLAVPVVLALAAAVGSYLPARRAAAVDPVEALKSE